MFIFRNSGIYGLLTDIEELKNKIWEVRWQPFFDGQEALKDLIDETDTFRDLLDSDAFVGKNGGLTDEGLANIALISSAMNEQKQSIKNYRTDDTSLPSALNRDMESSEMNKYRPERIGFGTVYTNDKLGETSQTWN